MTKLALGGAWITELTHSLDTHRMLWITRGQGRVTFAAAHHSYGPGSIVFLPAGQAHSFEVRPNIFGSAIDILDIAELGMPREPMHLRLRDLHEQKKFSGVIDQFQAELTKPRRGQTRSLAFQAGMLGVWLERTAEDLGWTKHTPTRAEALVIKFQKDVEARFSTGDNITVYANRLDVTPTHLTRCCRKVLGQSALAILNERIHHEARLLLSRTELPIKIIAEDLGFASAAYFTRAFLQLSGTSPTDFRLEHGQRLI